MQYVLWTTHNLTKFIWPWSVQADQWQADPYSNVRGDAGQEEERGGLLPEIWWSGVLQVRSRVSPKDVPVQCLKYTSSVLYAYHFMKKCFSLFMLDIKKIFYFLQSRLWRSIQTLWSVTEAGNSEICFKSE